MEKFLKEIVTDFLRNPLACYRRLRHHQHLAIMWQKAQHNGGLLYMSPSNIPGPLFN